MTWIGWQEGMDGDPVLRAKDALAARFSYAKGLDTTTHFGADLRLILGEYQMRRNMSGFSPPLRMDGVLDWNTQVALGLVKKSPTAPARPPRTFYTVAGTGSDMWTGYPADIARAVSDLWFHQPVFYPATAFPMDKSVSAGRRELVRLISERPVNEEIALGGYSQGAIVISEVWKHDILDPRGVLHDRLQYVTAAVTQGNPMREEGVAWGNVAAGIPVPDGRGIAGNRLVDTPRWWHDYAHGGNSPFGRDIYTDTPGDDAGELMEMIFNIVFSKWTGSNSVLEQIMEFTQRPVPEAIAAFRAIAFGIMFLGKGTGPHITYDIRPAIDHLRAVGSRPIVRAA